MYVDGRRMTQDTSEVTYPREARISVTCLVTGDHTQHVRIAYGPRYIENSLPCHFKTQKKIMNFNTFEENSEPKTLIVIFATQLDHYGLNDGKYFMVEWEQWAIADSDSG